ncbi:MAG: hypothetical protein IPO07_15125 [Haliscomenobacter sp.]|nr:hypothetical protein [Haliscomenobacter sp.]MBK9489949.1 hypothetical protein [Haliscomenobacter sp.]
MAFPKRGTRKITVEGIVYSYFVSQHEPYVTVYVQKVEGKCALLIGYFDLQTITPHIIRQVIEMGIADGWQESDVSGEFRMGYLDDRIDKTR